MVLMSHVNCTHAPPDRKTILRHQWCRGCGALREMDACRDDEWGEWEMAGTSDPDRYQRALEWLEKQQCLIMDGKLSVALEIEGRVGVTSDKPTLLEAIEEIMVGGAPP